MCIAAFIWQAHPLYPFLLMLNRDEYYDRPTQPLSWWEGEGILGGRDGLAGGTWLACTKNGKIAFLTNFREVESIPLAKSRGDLPVRFLKSKSSPMEFAEEVVTEADQYNGFNMILADLHSKTMVYVTNRPVDDNTFIKYVSPGIHVLTNTTLDSPWPKAERLRCSFEELLNYYGDGELPMKEMIEKSMMDTTKDDESMLPQIYSPGQEYYLSSIFVEAEFPKGHYGTRSMSATSVKTSGEVTFYERHRDKGSWEEKTVTYQLEKMA